jgi:polyisoprenoid-binding protein YceI
VESRRRGVELGQAGVTGELMSATETSAASYRVDGRRSRFVVKAFATGLLSAFGHSPTIAIRDLTGEVRFAPDRLEESSLSLQIKTESLAVVDDVRDSDRREMERQMREEVLETAHYPEIVFASARISAEKVLGSQYRARITGNLSLHGVTRPCEIEAQVIAGEETLRASGEFLLRQSHFNIKPVSAVGGTIKLKDELKFSFDIVAYRQ